MLKGQVFSEQVFKNEIFALFINTFLNGKNGVSDNFGNGMAVTYSGSNLTISSGAICIQGRFLQEDVGTTISAGTDNMFCKLVIEIDLDKTNTESDFQQGAYKVIKSSSGYPSLTQTNIVKNNSGVYQYELARFKTSSNGISDFQDMRTFLDFESIYDEIEQHIQDIDDGSAFVNKGDIAVLTGNMVLNPNTQENIALSPIKPLFTTKNINYPSGFNEDNCIILSKMFKYTQDRGYAEGWNNYAGSLDMLNGTLQNYIILHSNNIILGIGNLATDEKTYYYKIVLMKIS